MSFPADIKGCMKDCILSLFWPRKDIVGFFEKHGCTKVELSDLQIEGEGGLKRHEIIDVLFGKLDARHDSGLGPLRAMLQSLLAWSHFDSYYFDKLRKLDRAVATRNLEHLKQLQEIRDAKIKSDRERRVIHEAARQQPTVTLEVLRAEYLDLLAIQRVRQEIRDLNAILQTCPAFTNGEKYHFLAKPSLAHRDLYELIVAAPDAGGEDLFGQQGVQNNLMALLEDSESGKDRGNNPLEDYRLLFNFDLQIIQDGKVVDLLSKRMGVASNGEHRVPFYVIAGAALAMAYRIRPGASHVGAGLMILDEAFYGMDAQNTYVTATFLKSLGLQLMMAGPDSDVGKLVPLMDNYYDLARYGADVFAEHVVVKEAAHALFSSDIPMLHPELIDVAESQLLAAAGGG